MNPAGTPAMRGDDGFDPVLLGRLRVGYTSLIDAWHLGERPGDADACARLAVDQGVWPTPYQRACDHVPDLQAQPVHDPGRFWFVAYLEEQFGLIKAEIDAVLDSAADPVLPTLEDGWLASAGTWRQAYLYRDGRWQDHVTAHFPVTAAVLAEIPEVTTFSPGSILVSRLSPGTRIRPHCGATNAVLRLHLGVQIPDGASLRVADREMRWEEGRCLVFDDSFEHEVRHEGTGDRVVLIVDMAHPDLDPDLRAGLVARRPTPDDRIAAFLRERGLTDVTRRDGDVELTPDAPSAATLRGWLDAAGATGAQVRDGRLVWRRSDEG